MCKLVCPHCKEEIKIELKVKAEPKIEIHIDGKQFKGFIEKTAYNYIARR
jgi:sarcosine oxidase delta subunit